jgi:hypothetical protein
MESNGAPSKIHMSQDTARLLQEAGKKWAKKRADLVEGRFLEVSFILRVQAHPDAFTLS